jgi:S-adenosylmethionine hydrolase
MNKHLVLQSDFGLVDGAVAAMYGVALEVSPSLKVYDLTHEIPPYDIFAASYRLIQTLQYWPVGTVFVSVVDPGVGSNRKSVVAKTASGHYVVTPDNGTLTHVKRLIGIEEVREIEEAVHRRKNTEHSYTFHGRDVYAFTGAKLASDLISFEDVGQLLSVERIVEVDLSVAQLFEGRIVGCVDILDVRFGSCWTNIPENCLRSWMSSLVKWWKYRSPTDISVFIRIMYVTDRRLHKSMLEKYCYIPIPCITWHWQSIKEILRGRTILVLECSGKSNLRKF